MYRDMILKMEYHKQHILNSLVKQGYFPKKEEVLSKLQAIDDRIALFKQYKFVPGEKFNAKEMNHSLKSIVIDISFLYKIIEDIYIEEYNKMLLNIETHMTDLESLAVHYKKRASEEINGTSLGKTLLFATDNWDMNINDDSVEIDLNTLELIQGSEISCFANINNTDKRNVIFKFTTNDISKNFDALPYNYNNETYIVPGEIAIKDHDLTLSEGFNINSEIKIPFQTSLLNSYKILGGKDKMIVTDKITNSISIIDIPTIDKPFIATKNSFISFYTEGKGTMEYSFNKKPLHSNFSLQDGIVKLNKEVHKTFLDVEEGFLCYFTFDNDINTWATMEDAIVYDKYLVYTGILLVRDFRIKEYIKDKKTTYKVIVKINEIDRDEEIDCIYIKEVD